MKKCFVLFFAVMLGTLVLCGCSESNTSNNSVASLESNSDSSVVRSDSLIETDGKTVKITDAEQQATEKVTTSKKATTAAVENVSLGKQNALRSAKEYLDIMSFSYSGLREQLKYEGYSDEETKYAADNCGADWNEQAAKSAKDYIELMSFSKQGLIEQLEYEGFTHSQAEYGARAVGY